MSSRSSLEVNFTFDPKWQLVVPESAALLRETAAATEKYKDILGTDEPLLELELSDGFRDALDLYQLGYQINWKNTQFKKTTFSDEKEESFEIDLVRFYPSGLSAINFDQDKPHENIVNIFRAVVIPDGKTFGSQLFVTDTKYADEYDSDVNLEESVMVATLQNVDVAGFDLSHLTR